PRAAALLGRAAVRIEIERRDLRARLVADPEEADVVVPDRGLAVRGLDRHAEETPDEREEPIEDARERKVRAQLFVAVPEAALAQALRPEGDVPGREPVRLWGAVRAGERDEVGEVAVRGIPGSGAQLLEHALDRRHVGRHLGSEAELGVAREAEDARLLAPKPEDPAHELAIVVVAAGGARHERAVEALTQVAAARVLEERAVARGVERDAPRAGLGGRV